MSESLQAILSHKTVIDEHLVSYLSKKKTIFAQINALGGDIVDRLMPFVTSGKTARGCLVVYTYSLFEEKQLPDIYKAAAALEFFHSGFLIHDDIMDRDSLRRGKPSIWEQYRRVSQDTHTGISQAINAGDLCFFMAQELLSDLHIFDMVSRELQPVIIAQMQDVVSGRGSPLSTDDVLSLYRYKTARYTFSLSMAVGARLAHVSEDVIELFIRLGESMGLLFQIRDDELSITGNSAITGKPIDSDKKNAKQTLATLLDSEELHDLKASLLEHSDNEISNLPIESQHKDELTNLVRFCLARDK